MPDGTNTPVNRADSRTTRIETGEGAASHTAPPTHPLPSAVLWTMPVLVAGLVGLVWHRSRLKALRAWKQLAQEIGGEFKAKNQFAPERVFGSMHNRPFVLETGLGHEDDAPYYHTRAAFPINNPASLILGVRRKSLLEEAQTRREQPAIDLEDPDFARSFFVVCNEAQSLPEILSADVRRELSRYHDIELYVRLNEIEWRRAGEQNDMRIVKRLTSLLADLANRIDTLPKRPRTLSERLADEALISKGV